MYIMIGHAFNLNVGLEVYLIITAAPNLALSILASPGGVGPFEVTTRAFAVLFWKRRTFLWKNTASRVSERSLKFIVRAI